MGEVVVFFEALSYMSSGSDREMGLGPEEVVNASGQALLEDGEQSLLQRSGVQSRLSGMSLCCASGGTSGFKTKVEKGTLYLTTRRILFVAKKNQRILSLRFSDIFKERFNQPIFGCNNISGRVRVDYNGEADSYLEWRFYFLKGGVGTFLMAFLKCMKQQRRGLAASQGPVVATAVAVPVFDSTELATAIRTSATDPSDPTVVWVENAVVIGEAERANTPSS
mmetsp:Transcript_51402/g.116898  ORF Transcript_51402/g.116898 Transcript_51402/m.116898 type:complete len:223 (-) Transcript_51402:300-968(-)